MRVIFVFTRWHKPAFKSADSNEAWELLKQHGVAGASRRIIWNLYAWQFLSFGLVSAAFLLSTWSGLLGSHQRGNDFLGALYFLGAWATVQAAISSCMALYYHGECWEWLQEINNALNAGSWERLSKALGCPLKPRDPKQSKHAVSPPAGIN